MTTLTALDKARADYEETLAEVNRLGIVEACIIVKETMRKHNLSPMMKTEDRCIEIYTDTVSVFVSSHNPAYKMDKVAVFNKETMFIMNVEGKYITVEQLRKLVEVAL